MKYLVAFLICFIVSPVYSACQCGMATIPYGMFFGWDKQYCSSSKYVSDEVYQIGVFKHFDMYWRGRWRNRSPWQVGQMIYQTCEREDHYRTSGFTTTTNAPIQSYVTKDFINKTEEQCYDDVLSKFEKMANDFGKDFNNAEKWVNQVVNNSQDIIKDVKCKINLWKCEWNNNNIITKCSPEYLKLITDKATCYILEQILKNAEGKFVLLFNQKTKIEDMQKKLDCTNISPFRIKRQTADQFKRYGTFCGKQQFSRSEECYHNQGLQELYDLQGNKYKIKSNTFNIIPQYLQRFGKNRRESNFYQSNVDGSITVFCCKGRYYCSSIDEKSLEDYATMKGCLKHDFSQDFHDLALFQASITSHDLDRKKRYVSDDRFHTEKEVFKGSWSFDWLEQRYKFSKFSEYV